ncbi:helix-turn-helix transcriptional regulator [Paraburkholderia aspalathi]|uniref:helix-turn-helix domain-containing protein n=1 Tax=Paraburkholderia nemoris TaxID=2793076 RepID=UPI001F46E7B4|nr:MULTISPECIES: helix-turn-helix transcriptional regulator [Paraburkholderia]MBK3812853.1 helix-turn-helix transcriptional regulator [Paraburkholderia aspalathi]
MLTRREDQPLGLLTIGPSNRSIARDHKITVGTVKTHVNSIAATLDARYRREAHSPRQNADSSIWSISRPSGSSHSITRRPAIRPVVPLSCYAPAPTFNFPGIISHRIRMTNHIKPSP